MLAPLRRQLRRIRYYSASREETPWTRAADWTLIASFCLAFPVSILVNVTITRPSVSMTAMGMFARGDNAQTVALLFEGESPAGGWPTASFGQFTLQVIDARRGWPLVTSTRIPPARVEYDMFHEDQRRIASGDEADAHLREAIITALRREGHRELLQAVETGSSRVTYGPPLRWLVNAGWWWVVLYVSAMIALGTARLGAMIYERVERIRVKRLKRAGHCINCGYDLRGAEFSARCPECGELAE